MRKYNLNNLLKHIPLLERLSKLVIKISILIIALSILSTVLFSYRLDSFMLLYAGFYALIWGVIPALVVLIIIRIYKRKNQQV